LTWLGKASAFLAPLVCGLACNSWRENNAAVWGQIPKPMEANGGSGGGAPDAAAILIAFLQKYTFLRTFWSKFLLKTRF